MIERYQEKLHRGLIGLKKKILFAGRKPCDITLPIFVLGCGRSGTSMMLRIFQRDDRIEALGENNPKIAHNFMVVDEKIGTAVESCTAPVLVMKPILNSFEASKLLKTHTQARIIWMLRDYSDMIASTAKRFGPVVSTYMKDLVLFKGENNWLSFGMPDESLEILISIDSTTFTDYDWIGLVWWSVNRSILLDRLYESRRFLLLKYENLVRDPDAVLRRSYRHIGLQYRQGAAKYVHAASVGKGAAIQLHPIVRKMCENLAQDLTRFL